MLTRLDLLLRGRAGWFALILVFLFRLAFGLCSEFWFEDELQVYLIGLKFYTSGHLPLFGPDVVYTQTQIPGSLQGLLTGLPFFLWHAPEAPYILVNLLSTAGLALLAHYITKRIPSLPVAVTWLWVLTCPWALAYSTHVINPSYVLPAACVFFVAFMEAVPWLRTGYMQTRWAFGWMGFCLMWIFQLHLSWILLIPFIALAFIVAFPRGLRKTLVYACFFLAGCALTGMGLIPALINLGFKDTLMQTSNNLVVNWSNAGQIVTLLSRMLSLVSFELARFLGANTQARLEFLKEYLWISPFILIAGVIGLLQPLWLLIAAFLKKMPDSFKKLRWIVLGAFLFTWLSFFFSVKGPSSHTFYLMFPLMMIYSFYCWEPLLKRKWGKTAFIALLACGLVFHSVLMSDNFYKKSMYRDYAKVARAIEQKDYRILGERRPYDRNP